MKLISGTGVVFWVCVTGALGCTQVDERMQREACDQARPTTLNLATDVHGAKRGLAAGSDGFYLFSGSYSDAGVVHIDNEGAVLEELPLPAMASDLTLYDLALSGDGTALLAATPLRSNFGPHGGWLGKMDANWHLLWELEIGPVRLNQISALALADGGTLVAGTTWDDESGLAGDDPASDDVFWARVSEDGQVLWERRAQFAGGVHYSSGRVLVLTPDNEVRLVARTLDGLVVLGSDLLGENSVQQVLDTRLALMLSGVAALPDGRLAIASSRSAGAILTLVDRNGDVEFEHSFAQEQSAEAKAVAYNAARNEILLGGYYRGDDGGTQRTWMIATDLQGHQTWELTRMPLDLQGVDGNITALPEGRGPGIADLVPASDGSFLATGDSTFELTYFTVGAGGCHD